MFWFLLLAMVVVVAAVTLAVVGGGDDGPLPEAAPDHLTDPLPLSRPVGRADIEALRLPLAPRGYRMADVDDVLGRVGAELAERDSRIAELEAALAGAQATSVGGPDLFAQPAPAATDQLLTEQEPDPVRPPEPEAGLVQDAEPRTRLTKAPAPEPEPAPGIEPESGPCPTEEPKP
ncbi:DivIVA domain-containing protein [Streptomyces sp. NPDC051561]|uniref:DivIVA domain-containing protein n=1 Tax=Streptomyces sp. NPDC051561 TaxID=3365658 RepID=UPI003795535C